MHYRPRSSYSFEKLISTIIDKTGITAIEAALMEYVTTNMSIAMLAKKYGLVETQLRGVYQRQSWRDLKRDVLAYRRRKLLQRLLLDGVDIQQKTNDALSAACAELVSRTKLALEKLPADATIEDLTKAARVVQKLAVTHESLHSQSATLNELIADANRSRLELLDRTAEELADEVFDKETYGKEHPLWRTRKSLVEEKKELEEILEGIDDAEFFMEEAIDDVEEDQVGNSADQIQ